MEAVEEGEDTNHIMVLPTTSGEQGGGGAGEAGPEKNSSQRPKPRMQVEIRQVQSFFHFSYIVLPARTIIFVLRS